MTQRRAGSLLGPTGRAAPARSRRQHHGLHTVAELELHQHPADVGLHRRLAEVQRRGDLAVRQAPGHEHEHLALALGELRRGRRLGVGAGGAWAANSSMSRRVTDGASRASPAATTRTASTRSSAGVSLSRKPLAPARSAANTYSSRSKVVRISTRGGSGCGGDAGGGLDAVEARACGCPSGRRRAGPASASSIASSPSAASPTTSMSGSASRIIRKPGPHERLVVDDQAPDRQRAAPSGTGSVRPHLEAAAGAGPGVELAAVERRPAPACPSRPCPPLPLRPAQRGRPRPSSTTSTSSVVVGWHARAPRRRRPGRRA